MSALGAAEHLVAAAPTVPDSVMIEHSTHFPPNVIGVDLHFSRDAKALTGFAEAMGVTPLARTQEFGGEWFTESTVAGRIGDVPYFAWTRLPVAAPQVLPLSTLDTTKVAVTA
jgi:hypothetical protein